MTLVPKSDFPQTMCEQVDWIDRRPSPRPKRERRAWHAAAVQIESATYATFHPPSS